MPDASVFRAKPSAVRNLFGRDKVVIGVIHLMALPGSPAYDGEAMDALIDHAVREARAYAAGGVHGLIVENHGDIPFAKPDRLGPETDATRLPVLIGNGVTEANAGQLLEVADGLIVASALKEEGVWWTPVSEAKVASLLRSVRPALHD
ncbi:MAG: BtpA/SgcQ family protein [Trueperaceae bacterium]